MVVVVRMPPRCLPKKGRPDYQYQSDYRHRPKHYHQLFERESQPMPATGNDVRRKHCLRQNRVNYFHCESNFVADDAGSSKLSSASAMFSRCIRYLSAWRLIFSWSDVLARLKWFCSSKELINSRS